MPHSQPTAESRRILLRVNVPAFAVGAFEATMGFAFTAFAAQAMGSAADANLLLFWFWFSLFVFELPTGYIVDRWGAKGSLIASLLLRAAAFALYFQVRHSVVGLCVASVLAGVAVTFMSGLFSTQILVWSTQRGLNMDPSHMMRWVMVVRAGSLIVGSVLGYGVTTTLGLEAIWLVCAALAVMTAGYVALLWPRLTSQSAATMGQHYRNCATELTRRRLWGEMLEVSAVRTVSTAAMSNAAMVLVPGLQKTPVLLLALSLLLGGITLTAPRIADRVESKPRWQGVLSWLFLPALVVLPWLVGAWVWLAFTAMVVSALCAEMHYRTRFYAAVDVALAGSATSTQGLIENAMGAMAFALSWLFLHHTEPSHIWWLYAALTMLLAVLPQQWRTQHRAASYVPTSRQP